MLPGRRWSEGRVLRLALGFYLKLSERFGRVGDPDTSNHRFHH
jgi:hypothetical protein